MTKKQSPRATASGAVTLSVAVVLPVHNEAEAIEVTLTEIKEKIVEKVDGAELFVAEDGSSDGTKEILSSLANSFGGVNSKFHVKAFPERKGYPKAARDAILGVDSSYDYILFMDSDGQYEPDDFFALWAERSEADFVVGCRVVRAEPAYRRILSLGLNLLERHLFDVSIRDVTSAFRLMRRSLAQAVAENVKYSKHNFWSEFTVRSAIQQIKMREVPVSYRPRLGESKVYAIRKMPKIVWDEFAALARTWLENRQSKR